ncbi:MAG: hypothetical protein WD851_02500 [Pirellulales bacterium]
MLALTALCSLPAAFFSGELGPSLMLFAGLALICGVLLRRSFRTSSRARAASSSTAAVELPRLVDREQVELSELGRDIVGQIDSKLIVLQELIAQSERQIVRMEGLIEDLEQRSERTT